ncbi:MAG: hypothetical protein CME43_01865 [Haliea sp.]|uniref:hypothetical protein n=1 Tax=Haliea sp. TaxID=1932666 RepID=UPI000C5C8722|nr:hypothetical protein [Haliea sp.]MBM68208.1 hypothetical protein [Haliea sp.]|tara:strand:+ start:224 stop:499 length:276 start_codon:yes stop_codon:yes gene_type:complete
MTKKHTGYYAYMPDSHEEDASLEMVDFEEFAKTTVSQESQQETKESLEDVMKALEVVQAFAIRHWKPCLRDCCGDAIDDVEEMLEQLRKEQ